MGVTIITLIGPRTKRDLARVEGRWIYTKAYSDCLRALCRSLGFQVTNNHAFRMSLNSNVFIPLGIPVTERARLLGHSVETNEKYKGSPETAILKASE